MDEGYSLSLQLIIRRRVRSRALPPLDVSNREGPDVFSSENPYEALRHGPPGHESAYLNEASHNGVNFYNLDVSCVRGGSRLLFSEKKSEQNMMNTPYIIHILQQESTARLIGERLRLFAEDVQGKVTRFDREEM